MARSMIDSIKSAAGLVAIACADPSPAHAVVEVEVAPMQAALAMREAPEGLAAFEGEYAFAGGEPEREALRDAIDAVVEEMNPLVRGIARTRLLESNRIAARVAIGTEGDVVTVSFDERAYTAELGASAIEVTGVDGKPLQLTHRFRKKELVQSFDGSQGGRRNAMSLRGNRLRIRVLVHSESLPADLSYQLTFAKR